MVIVSLPTVTTDPEAAVRALDAGGLAAIPTETVYGLAADATQPDAVERIFAVKDRPRGHPLILHLGHPDLRRWEADGWIALDDALAERADRLAGTCWPGPLTMVVPRGAAVTDSVTGGRATVAIRVPAHPMALAVLNHLGRPVAAPSANRFGHVSPTTAAHVVTDIGARLDPTRDVILDGGPSVVGLESTIVELVSHDVQLLRPGAVSRTELEAILGCEVAAATGPARASGMLTAHYAPACRVVIAEGDDVAAIAARERASGRQVDVLDCAGDPHRAAAGLYASLRAADDDGVDTLIVVPPPSDGIGVAVRDRLQRAAAASRLRADEPAAVHEAGD